VQNPQQHGVPTSTVPQQLVETSFITLDEDSSKITFPQSLDLMEGEFVADFDFLEGMLLDDTEHPHSEEDCVTSLMPLWSSAKVQHLDHKEDVIPDDGMVDDGPYGCFLDDPFADRLDFEWLLTENSFE
jgi:hypothetical protein